MSEWWDYGLADLLLFSPRVYYRLFETMNSTWWLVVASAVVYTLGVQLPTFLINVPLNNALQMLNVDDMDELMLASERRSFENRWVRWNLIRTAFASGVSVSLMLVLLWL